MTFLTSELFLKIVIFPGMITMLLASAVIIWFERKFMAKVQLRVGPQYAGKVGGILQPVADFMKLMFKEPIIPDRADKKLFQIAPIIALTLAATTVTIIPVGPGLVISNLEFGLLFIFAIMAIYPTMAVIIAWASHSTYPFLGGLRALFQQIAYEVPFWLSTVGLVMLANTLNLTEIVNFQSGFWLIVLQPLGAIAFFIALLAEIERVPFDLPEAEPEIVTGWMSEYSGMYFGILMVSMYLKLYVGAMLFTTLFLGGWIVPAIVQDLLPPFVWFFIKTSIVLVLLIFPRAVLPRVRLSDMLRIGWNRLLYLAILNLFIAIFLKMTIFGGLP